MFLELLRIRHFRNLWLGQALSRIGDAFYFLAPLFVIKKLFDDNMMIGLVGAVEALPYLLFGTLGGALADRIDRKKIMLWTDFISAIWLFGYLTFWIVYPGDPPKWPFFVFGFVLASVRVFFFPARQASVPRLVPEERLMAANAISAATDQFMWLAGNLCVFLVSSMITNLPPLAFLKVIIVVNAASFLASAYFLYLLPSIVPERTIKEEEHFFHDVVEGVKYAKTDKVIGLSLLATFGLGLFMSPFFVVYLSINDAWFGGKMPTLALIEACFIIGMLSMSYFVPKLKLRRPGLVYSLGLAIAGVSVFMMGFSPWVIVYGFWNLICGFAIGIVDVPMRTYQQLKVPDMYRGRIMSLGQLIWMSVQPLGMLFGGFMTGKLGVVKMHMLMGSGFALTGITPLLNKEFRDAKLPEGAYDHRPEEADENPLSNDPREDGEFSEFPQAGVGHVER
ncbi:MAG TPA: MFS transporter [Fimbriimonas sp.]|nr:MFS transporter [Fimbriimonas sp.]